jgi:hypothetical protein
MAKQFYVPLIKNAVDGTVKNYIALVQPPFVPVTPAEVLIDTPGSGTFIVPENVIRLKVEVAGAGGGRSGYGADEDGHTSARMPGGRGGLTVAYLNVVPGASLPFNVGLAGTNGADDTADPHYHHAGNGVNGGNSTFDAIVALGGGGGIAGYFLPSANGESYISSGGRPGTSHGSGGIGASYSVTLYPFAVTDTPAENGWIKISYGGDLQKQPAVPYIFAREVTT